MMTLLSRYILLLVLVGLGTILNGCKSNTNTVDPDQARGTQPAVMVSVIGSSPGPRTTYVGAFANVPTGNVDTKNMLEFGNAYFYAYDGSVFVWDRDAVTVTRYEVGDNLKLTKGATISFANYGFKYGADLAFISASRAYMVVSELNKVIVWDPSKMEVGSTFDFSVPTQTGLESYPSYVGISGNNLIYTIDLEDYNNLKSYTKNVVAMIPTTTNGPVKVIEDSRTLIGINGYVMANGDTYLMGEGNAGTYSAYGPSNYPPAGILRIKAGATTYDPSYFVDLEKATGSSAIAANWKIDDNTLLLRIWDPATKLPTNIDDYWSGKSFISKKLDLATGAVTDFPALAKGGFASNIQDVVDSKTYFPLPNSDGSADIAYQLSADGIKQIYTIPGGGYWGMRRIR